jgi:hypothetical protein
MERAFEPSLLTLCVFKSKSYLYRSIPVAAGRLSSPSNLIEERGAQRFPDTLTLLEAGIFEANLVDSLNV